MFFGWKPRLVPNPVNNFYDWSEEERSIAVLVNLVREENKPLSMLNKNEVTDLVPNKLCWEEARKRCEVQYSREVISHEGVGVAFTAITSEGYTNPAEILAYGYSSPETVVNAWFKSSKHKNILLGLNFKHFGVAKTNHGGRNYYCILFCK